METNAKQGEFESIILLKSMVRELSEPGDQFYDSGIDLSDEKFDTLEDQHIEEALKPPEPFVLPDYANELLAGCAKLF